MNAETSPRQLILTLFGLYARAQEDWLSVAALIVLMVELGVEASAVRSSVSRLKRRGVLHPATHAGQKGYALSADALAVLADGDRRIWEHERASGDDWVVVGFSVPEAQRARRHELRAVLTHLGFAGTVTGVWVAPGQLAEEAMGVLERRGLAAYTELFRGRWLGEPAVEELWDLTAIREEYDAFLHCWRPLTGRRRVSDAEAFAAYVPMLTAWRRLPYADPGLPLDLLPRGWPGSEAEQLFADLDTRLRTPADRHARALIHAGGPASGQHREPLQLDQRLTVPEP